MSSDPLPAADILTQSPNDPDYEAFYAEVVATERGRSFLAEYASRNLRPDASKLIGTIARLESALRHDWPTEMPRELFARLVDLDAAIAEVEPTLAGGPDSLSEPLFAAERIDDIAVALRQRNVEPVLCDALEAAAREVGDALVRNKVAAASSQSAIAQSRDLGRRVKEIIALVVSIDSLGVEATVGRNPAMAASAPSHEKLPSADVCGDALPGNEADGARASPAFAMPNMVGSLSRSMAELAGTGADQPLAERVRRHDAVAWFDAAVPEYAQEPVSDPPCTGSLDDAGNDAPNQRLPMPSPLPDPQALAGAAPEEDVARERRDLLHDAPIESPIVAKQTFATGEVTVPSPGSSVARAVTNDSFADILALGEEELIALFS
jgi:hypothetical protein